MQFSTSKSEKVCWLCDNKEWWDMDYLRSEAANMIVCKKCGLITFDRFHDDTEIKAYYDKDYRTAKTVNTANIVTSNRKLGYHGVFLGEWFEKRKKDGKQTRVGEIGSGIGYFLKWCRDHWGCTEIAGSEYTTSLVRYAEHAASIKLTKDFDFTKQYDLVCLYHTLEHLPNPKETLTKLRDCISDDGIVYIATPVWMEEMMKWGGGGFKDFDDHFHPDHINAWSRWHVLRLFEETGWKIIKENTQMYGYTIMLEKTVPNISQNGYPKSEEVCIQLSDMQRAATAYKKANFPEAIRLYPKFVDGYLAEVASSQKDLNRQMDLLAAGEALCTNTRLFNIQRGLLLYQYNRLDDAERELVKGLEIKPHDDNILIHLGMINLKKGEALLGSDKTKAMPFLKQAVAIFDKIIGINPGMYQQCFDMIAYIFSKVPGDKEEPEPVLVAPHAEGAPNPMID